MYINIMVFWEPFSVVYTSITLTSQLRWPRPVTIEKSPNSKQTKNVKNRSCGNLFYRWRGLPSLVHCSHLLSLVISSYKGDRCICVELQGQIAEIISTTCVLLLDLRMWKLFAVMRFGLVRVFNPVYKGNWIQSYVTQQSSFT